MEFLRNSSQQSEDVPLGGCGLLAGAAFYDSRVGRVRAFILAIRRKEAPEGEMGPMIRVLLVDDDAVYCRVFVLLLETQPDIQVVGEASSLAKARTMLEGVDVAILDRVLPDGDGLDLIGELREASPGANVLVMSAFADRVNRQEALEAGADWALGKVKAPYEVFAAIRRLRSGQSTAIHPTS